MSDLKTQTHQTKEVKQSVAMKAAQADFASTFEAFKDANDARLGALEKKQGDSLLTEKVERINSALDMQAKRIENLALSTSQPVLNGDINPSETKSAWSSYIRTGDGSELASLEGKSLTAGVDAEGGYVAPAETESRIDRALTEASPFRSISTVRRVGAGYFKKPVSAGGAASGWAGETDARIETDAPQLELLEFPAGELYAMPAATQTLLDDGVADVDQWLADEVRDVFAAQETAAFTSGDGINTGWKNLPLSADYIGETITLKASAAERDADPLEFDYQARHLRPLAPVHPDIRYENGQVHITWIRQTRVGGDSWSGLDVPLGEEVELYRVQIFDGEVLIADYQVSEAELIVSETEIDTANMAAIAQGSQAYGWGAEIFIAIAPS